MGWVVMSSKICSAEGPSIYYQTKLARFVNGRTFDPLSKFYLSPSPLGWAKQITGPSVRIQAKTQLQSSRVGLQKTMSDSNEQPQKKQRSQVVIVSSMKKDRPNAQIVAVMLNTRTAGDTPQ